MDACYYRQTSESRAIWNTQETFNCIPRRFSNSSFPPHPVNIGLFVGLSKGLLRCLMRCIRICFSFRDGYLKKLSRFELYLRRLRFGRKWVFLKLKFSANSLYLCRVHVNKGSELLINKYVSGNLERMLLGDIGILILRYEEQLWLKDEDSSNL